MKTSTFVTLALLLLGLPLAGWTVMTMTQLYASFYTPAICTIQSLERAACNYSEGTWGPTCYLMNMSVNVSPLSPYVVYPATYLVWTTYIRNESSPTNDYDKGTFIPQACWFDTTNNNISQTLTFFQPRTLSAAFTASNSWALTVSAMCVTLFYYLCTSLAYCLKVNCNRHALEYNQI